MISEERRFMIVINLIDDKKPEWKKMSFSRERSPVARLL